MESRSVQRAVAVYLDDLDYLATRLKADPLAAEFVPRAELAAWFLQNRNEEWQVHRRAAQAAKSELAKASREIGNGVRFAQHMILESVDYRRRSAEFLACFPLGLVPFTRSPHEDQLTAVRALARRCVQNESQTIRDLGGLLHAAADRMEALMARRSEALAAESESFGRLQVQKLLATASCQFVEHRLAEWYPNERGRVRSYFRPSSRQRNAAEPGRTRPTTVVGAAADAAPMELTPTFRTVAAAC